MGMEAKIVVDQHFTGFDGEVVDGKRMFKGVQRAIDSLDSSATLPRTIYIKKGIYHEKLEVNKQAINLIGEDRDQTILTYNVANGSIQPDGNTYGTFGSASVTVRAKDFVASNLTFENAFDYMAEIRKADDDATKVKNVQAVAFKTVESSNNTQIKQCRFRGYQDTLLVNHGTHYFDGCIIEGAVDFIFGAGQAVFDNCEIISLDRGSKTDNGFITAASTLITQKYGFLFENCKLVKENEQMADHSVYLGRPWHPGKDPEAQGNVVFKNCVIGSHIKQDGWTEMSGFSHLDARLYEYGNKGPGALLSENRKILSELEVKNYTVDRVLGR